MKLFLRTLKNKWFTLFELSIVIAIFGMLMISVLLSVENMSIARIKTDNRVALLQELYFFSEQLVTNVKNGGIIDYEEYWNRKSYNTAIGSGHYIYPDGVGNYGTWGNLAANFGSGLYYCRSGDSDRMWTWGCLIDHNASSFVSSTGWNYSGTYQRYGEYVLQYMDYNGNADADGGIPWNEDADTIGNIVGDEDDKDIGDGPIVLSGAIPELYLINTEDNTRTYFRWNIIQDTGTGGTCVISWTWVPNGNCRGNVQVLKLVGKDLWYDHSGSTSSTGAFDGIVDSWVCHPDWRCAWSGFWPLWSYGTGATGKDSEWVDLFPDTINVKSLSFTAYPQKDPWKSWAAPDTLGTSAISPFIHPYVRLQLTLGFAWGKRRAIRNDDPTISINTSVNLSNM